MLKSEILLKNSTSPIKEKSGLTSIIGEVLLYRFRS